MDMKNIQVRVDAKLKQDADQIFGQLGTNTNDAIKIFLQTAVRAQGFPFRISLLTDFADDDD